MTDKPKSESVYLNDGSILPWERPVGEGEISLLRMYNGSTTLVDFLGLEPLNVHVGENPRSLDDPRGPSTSYHLIGSAAKYLADIGRLSKGEEFNIDRGKSPEIRREILFYGNIGIYQFGIIPSTKIMGYDLVQQGRIWTANSEIEVAKIPGGLTRLILGSFGTPDQAVKRVEAVIAGYKDQEENRRRAQLKAENNAFVRGGEVGSRNCF